MPANLTYHFGSFVLVGRGAKHKAKKVHRALSHHITKSPKRDRFSGSFISSNHTLYSYFSYNCSSFCSYSTVSAESLALGIPTVEGSVSEVYIQCCTCADEQTA